MENGEWMLRQAQHDAVEYSSRQSDVTLSLSKGQLSIFNSFSAFVASSYGCGLFARRCARESRLGS
jgi:hypothetical protein